MFASIYRCTQKTPLEHKFTPAPIIYSFQTVLEDVFVFASNQYTQRNLRQCYLFCRFVAVSCQIVYIVIGMLNS